MLATLTALLAGPALAATPGEGDVVITEILPAPASGMPEWIELYNVGGGTADLAGCTVISSTSSGWEDSNPSSYPLDAISLGSGQHTLIAQNKSVLSGEPSYDAGLGDGLGCVAYDDSGEGRSCLSGAEVDAIYSGGFNLSNSGDEILCLVCGSDGADVVSESCDAIDAADVLVDEVVLDYEDFEGLCGTDDGKNCSISLDPNNYDAGDNDDPSAWCTGAGDLYYDLDYDDKTLTPAGNAAYGTPGTENSCPVQEPSCDDAVFFTEVMIKGEEWLELYNSGGSSCGLYDCVLSYQKEDESEVDEHTIGGAVNIPAGGHVLLAKGESEIAVGEIGADYEYGTLSFTDGDAALVSLSCDGALVDTFPIDWSLFEDDCLAPGTDDVNCAVNLKSDFYSGADNDDLSNWCIGPSEDLYTNPSDDLITGTPGETGECQSCECPGEGELIFTEAMPAPQGTPEWFELTNLTDSDFDLTWCKLQSWKPDSPEDVTSYSLALGGGGAIAANATQLMSYKACIDSEVSGGDTSDTAGLDTGASEADCLRGEIIYSSVTQSNSSEAVIALKCLSPDGSGEVLVDQFGLDYAGSGARDGHSLMFDPAGIDDPSTENDAPDAWCEAAFSQEFLEVAEDECNYGTPGEVGECRTLVDDWPSGGPACRCSSAGGPGAWWFALFAPLLALRRRD